MIKKINNKKDIVLLDYLTCLNNFSSDIASWVIRTCIICIYIYILLTKGLVIKLYQKGQVLSYYYSYYSSSCVTLRLTPLKSETEWTGYSGQRLISSIGKTKRKAFFFCKKNISKFSEFSKFFLGDFSDFFFSGFVWTGELWSNWVFLILRNKQIFFKAEIFFFKYIGLKKGIYFLRFSVFWDFVVFNGFFQIFGFLNFFLDIFFYFFFYFLILFKITKVTTKCYIGYY